MKCTDFVVFRIVLFLSFLILPSVLISQEIRIVEGKVVDSQSGLPLAFVNIVINNGTSGISTDIDGRFTIRSRNAINTLNLTYVGYEKMTYRISQDPSGPLLIAMVKTKIELPEVTIYPTENPAHRIIDLVILNRDNNDPEKLKSFSYTSYDRTIFTVQLDSVIKEGEIISPDSLIQTDTIISDSSFLEMQEFFDKQDIAIMESVTERMFLSPDLNYQNVIANRISGFKDPIFVFLLSQLQSTSFYKEMFHLMDKHYVNPISKGSTRKYFFLIEDTTFTERMDTVFIISYQPKINTNFDGMEGVLYINSNGWAIQNVIAKPAEDEGIRVRIQHMYELIDGKHWFPVQLNSDLIFLNAVVSSGDVRANMVGIGKSYIKDIVINPELVKRQFDVLGIDVEPDSHEKSDEFWGGYRIDSLSERDQRTYHFMDSIGKEANLDKFSLGVETVLNGRIPVKFIDIDLDKIVKYNGSQGWYLGLGLHTNDRLSKRLKFGGYWGYGFRDQTAKYGGDIKYTISRRKELDVWAAYSFDLKESAGVQFLGEKSGILSGKHWRDLLINRMNLTEDLNLGLSTRVLRDFKVHLGFSSNSKQGTFDYKFGVSDNGVLVTTDEFDFTELKIGFRYAFREEFIVTKRSRISLGTRYPILHFQYTRGFNDLLRGDFEYNRYDLKVTHSFYVKYLGRSQVEIRGGLIDGILPYCNLYNGNGSYREFTVYAPSSFSTMRMNEFLSDRYISLFYMHNFGKLLFKTPKFQPEFLIATNIAFGLLKNNDGYHYNVDYKTLEHGYFESGVLINNMLNLRIYSIGIGGFYRYGGYSLGSVWENMALKFTIVFPFNN